MFEDRVRDVTSERIKGDQGYTQFYYTRVGDGRPDSVILSEDHIGAVSTWLAQPKPPTAEDQARDLVNAWYLSPQMYSLHIDSAKRGELVRAIAEAIENAAREARE